MKRAYRLFAQVAFVLFVEEYVHHVMGSPEPSGWSWKEFGLTLILFLMMDIWAYLKTRYEL